MGILTGSHEIVELTEHDDDSESKTIVNTGKQHMPTKKYSLEDDINKLFEAIEIDRSRRIKDDLCKRAMKRPMRFGPSQVSGIGISEPVSLKQALRGSCISQASEMASVKKRVTRLSVSPGQFKGNLVEILLTPEKNASEFLNKGTEFGQMSTAEMSDSDNMTKIETEKDINPFPSNVGLELSKSELEQNKNLELVNSFVSTGFDKKLPVLDEILTTMGNRLKKEQKLTESSKMGFGSSKQNFRTQNIIKRKIAQKTNTAKTQIQHHKGASNVHEYQTSKLVHHTPDKEREGLEKVSPASSSNTSSIVNSISVDYNSSNSRGNKIMTNSDEKSRSRSKEKGDISQSSKSSIGEYSSTTSHSEESYMSGSSRSGYRPHMSKDLKWEAIHCVQKQNGSLGLQHFKLIRKLGGGDIGTVYLSELIGTSCLFSVKVMNNESLVTKKKIMRAQTEKEILEILDHPFLPTLYAHFVTNKFSCLVMEYCPGGDLHVLRQKQVTKSFSEQAARFYVAEVLLALEYLHMMGVVYRDLKPENILVREDGHIMLSDFDLSLKCSTNPTLLKSSSPQPEPPNKISDPSSKPSCIDPFCLQPSWNLPCFTPATFLSKTQRLKSETAPQIIQLVVEPTTARSNSFVGTHEYLAPEIVKGEGHGSAVDWWMLGIFLYELLYGKTPFKGSANEETVSFVVSQCLGFPECSMVSFEARDLIGRLLVKEPENRLGFVKGAVEIKGHSFFDGLNWALIRCETPPEMPKLFDLANVVPGATCNNKTNKEDEIEFEMF